MNRSNVCVAALSLAACTGTYEVRRADLAEAQRRAIAGEDDVAIPARDEDGELAFLRVERIRRVVEQGRSHLNQEVEFTVTNTRQTTAGRMIFGRMGETTAPARRARGNGNE